jgi:shikimate dehydrogenase
MTDRYAVFGNPIAHSKSPRIHAEFARQTGQDLSYEAILAPADGFAHALRAFAAAGGRGANVTVPFKQEAYALATRHSVRAAAARAANTLSLRDGVIEADNTDGAGLVADLVRNLGFLLAGRRILLLGAGGAARGVLLPLLAQNPATLVLTNRTPQKAEALVAEFESLAPGGVPLSGCGFAALRGLTFDLVINATAASLADEAPPLPPGLYAPGSLAYDMMYGRGPTPFLRAAKSDAAGRLADGLGMLVEQAAEAFLVWRGLRPDTAPVLERLRREQPAW